jgi:hypothetical protein
MTRLIYERWPTHHMVELERLYSNPAADADHLRLVLSATATPRPPEGPKRHRRQRQHRLSMTEITKLIKKYEQQVPVKDLAKQFGIHRLTVTTLLRRHGVELRRSGLEPAEVQTATRL